MLLSSKELVDLTYKVAHALGCVDDDGKTVQSRGMIEPLVAVLAGALSAAPTREMMEQACKEVSEAIPRLAREMHGNVFESPDADDKSGKPTRLM